MVRNLRFRLEIAMTGRTLSLAALILGAGLALSACGTPAGNVSVMQSDSIALVPGSTYAWAPTSETTQQSADPRLSNDIVRERLRSAVDTALSAKGYRQVSNPSEATLLARYHVGLESRTETRVDNLGGPVRTACGFRGCVSGWGMYGPPMVDVQNINYTQGTLIVDLVDARSGKLAWRATSDKRVDSNDSTAAGLNAILADMTKTLPGNAVAAR